MGHQTPATQHSGARALVYGRQSIFETEAARIYADLLPNSELVLVEGGHSPFLEDPKGFAASVDEFFQK